MIQLDPIDMEMVSQTVGEKELAIKQRDRKLREMQATLNEKDEEIARLEQRISDLQAE